MKILFGAIVVKGAGRINGHVIRNFRGSALLTKLALPTQTQKYSQSSARRLASTSFAYYSKLALVDREEWTNNANKIQFPDRWGNMRYLPVKNFVSKIFINLSNAKLPMVDAINFNSAIPLLTVGLIQIDATAGRFIMNGFENSESNYGMIYIRENTNSLQNFQPIKIPFILGARIFTMDDDVLYDSLIANGAKLSAGSYFTVGIRAVSESGLISPMAISTVFAF